MSKQNWKACFLRFKGPLHLSQGKSDNYDKSSTHLHSDTLKSAMFAVLKRYLGDKVEDSFFDAFRMSSAFPFLDQSDQPLLFLPRPLTRQLPISIKDLYGSRLDKQLKNIDYLSLDLFNKLFVDGASVVLEKDFISGDGSFAHTASLRKLKIFYSNTGQHVYVSNGSKTESTTYHVDELRFVTNAGLYFLIDAEDEKILNLIRLALDLLSDAGIGTDRNNGYGYFDFDAKRDIRDIKELNFSGQSSHEMNLSLYCPRKEEVQSLENSSYKIIKRGGWISAPRNNRHLSIRKKSIHMFKEGSLFAKIEEPRSGKLVDLKPDLKYKKPEIPEIDYPIWREGRALFFPVVLTEAL